MPELTGVSTEIWGPKAWGFLHAVTFRYPEDEASKQKREAAFHMLSSLTHILPCERCRKHFRQYMSDSSTGIKSAKSPHLANRRAFAKWMVSFHNAVNVRLSKPVMRFEDVEDAYSGDYVCPPEPDSNSIIEDLCSRERTPVERDLKVHPAAMWCAVISALCIVVFLVARWKGETAKRERLLRTVAMLVSTKTM